MAKAELTRTERSQVMIAAAVGGVAPNVLHVAMCLTSEPRRDPGVNLGYVTGLCLLAALGCLVAWFWNERVPRRAFYLGIGLPAMLQIAMSNPTHQTAGAKTALLTRAQSSMLSRFIETSAYAQDPPAASSQASNTTQGSPPMASAKKTLKIKFKNVPTDAQLVFSGADGQKLDELRPDWARYAGTGEVTIQVPSGATEVEVFSAFARNAPDEKLRLGISKTSLQPLLLEGKSDFVAGFLRALGRDAADSMKLEPIATTSLQ